jgi:predicted component of type VI protein secretion system
MPDASASARRHIYFTVKEPKAPDRILILDTQELTIGRSNDSDLQPKYTEVSRRHAVIKRDGQKFSIQNMSNSGTTTVNGRAVTVHSLSHQDVIRISELEIVYSESTENPAKIGPKLEYVSQLKEFAAGGIPCDNPEATILGVAPSKGGEGDAFSVSRAGDFGYGNDSLDDIPDVARNLDLELDGLGFDEPVEMTPEALAPVAKPAPAARPLAANAPPKPLAQPKAAVKLPAKPSVAAAATAASKPPAKPSAAAAATVGSKPAAKPNAPAKPPAPKVTPDTAWSLDDIEVSGEVSASKLSVNLEIEGLPPELGKALGSLLGKVISLPPLKIRLKGDDLG